jgi:hypothetical protein
LEDEVQQEESEKDRFEDQVEEMEHYWNKFKQEITKI